ncbi:MAG: hypothetical protein H7257_00150 [Taibaiella sp.]|nr:hypothetical protein [Taibaiella sp.]
MIVAGVVHFCIPETYAPFIPVWMPAAAVVYVSGAVEILLGLGCLFSKTRRAATLGILLLMIAFLPLHVADALKESPAIGSHAIALVRLPLQFVLIAWAWYIWRKQPLQAQL